jgi:molybdopterin synthase catalytic subunit
METVASLEYHEHFREMSGLLPASSHAEKYVESELCTLHYVGNFQQGERKVFVLIFLSK